MIDHEHLKQIAAWAHDLPQNELERAAAGIAEKQFARNQLVCARATRAESLFGIVSGLVKLSAGSVAGKNMSFMGVPAGGWFGEAALLKTGTRRYDVIALRDTRVASMDRNTFFWLFENSISFNRFVVMQLTDRLNYFLDLLEHDRLFDVTTRMARCIGSFLVLYPASGSHLDLTQEELGLLSGLPRSVANQCLKALERDGIIRVQYGGVTVLLPERLGQYGDDDMLKHTPPSSTRHPVRRP